MNWTEWTITSTCYRKTRGIHCVFATKERRRTTGTEVCAPSKAPTAQRSTSHRASSVSMALITFVASYPSSSIASESHWESLLVKDSMEYNKLLYVYIWDSNIELIKHKPFMFWVSKWFFQWTEQFFPRNTQFLYCMRVFFTKLYSIMILWFNFIFAVCQITPKWNNPSYRPWKYRYWNIYLII